MIITTILLQSFVMTVVLVGFLAGVVKLSTYVTRKRAENYTRKHKRLPRF